jgi:hypothetical protein
VLEQRRVLLAQQQAVFDPDEMTDGERIDWKISRDEKRRPRRLTP